MATELRRGAVRVVSNYARLMSTLILGIIAVPILIRAVGTDGFGLVSLIAGTTGIVLIVFETVNSSLTFEVGNAFHEDDDRFREVYASANIVAFGVAVVVATLFLGLFPLMDVLHIPDELVGAAKWMIVAVLVDIFVRVITAAPNNLYFVTERFVAQNISLVLQRAPILIASIVTLLVYQGEDFPRAIVFYNTLRVGISILVQLVSVGYIVTVERRGIPRFRSATRTGIKSVLHTAKWNAAALGAQTIHIQIDQILMNVFFGLFGNAVFGLAQRLAAYVRMIVNGMSSGIDAVTVRINKDDSGEGLTVQELLHHSTRLHAVAMAPALLFLLLYSEEFFHLWIAKAVEDPEKVVPAAVLVVSVLLFGFSFRAMSDNWTGILYGAGHVRKYAPMIVAGALINPALVWVLWKVLPEHWVITCGAFGYTIVFFGVHFIGIPIVVSRCFKLSLWKVYRPVIRPPILALLALPVAWLYNAPIEEWTVIRLLAALASYCSVYAMLCLFIEMNRDERQRISSAIRRRLPGRIAG